MVDLFDGSFTSESWGEMTRIDNNKGLIQAARLATGSGRLEKVLWEFLPVKSY